MRDFHEATRSLTSALAPVEKRVLVWIARRLPQWVNSDHLTGLALVAMLFSGLAYWLARVTSAGLLFAVAGLAINWSATASTARARVRGHQRPRSAHGVLAGVRSICAEQRHRLFDRQHGRHDDTCVGRARVGGAGEPCGDCRLRSAELRVGRCDGVQGLMEDTERAFSVSSVVACWSRDVRRYRKFSDPDRPLFPGVPVTTAVANAVSACRMPPGVSQ